MASNNVSENIDTRLKEGTLLDNGHYRIEHVLGQGGFGITYLAKHTLLNKAVAVKEFFPASLCNREKGSNTVLSFTQSNTNIVSKLRQKFLKEASHIAEMDSPYIVRITDVFEENDTAYYVMDYIDGYSLAQLVKENGPLPAPKAIEYVSKIGEALTYIHSKKINHLDVKPANIMVRRSDDNPILVDFGLSKRYDSEGNQTSTTPVGISHGYAPMEQYSDDGVTEFSSQTDLYSLAATLYYLLSDTTPPAAGKLLENGLSFPKGFPKALEAPILKAMSPRRKDRHESVAAFVAQIRNNKTSPRHKSQAKEQTKIYAEHTELAQTPPSDTEFNNTVISESDAGAKKKSGARNRIISIIVFLLLVGGGVLAYLYYDSASHKQESEIISAKETVEIDENDISDENTIIPGQEKSIYENY
ncbi:MAG: protein kinase [Prevotella sp.]|nr:protein kinase [Prevotella sp.]MCM1074760.1 protein kinase [Ruminococcus sp.]